MVINHIALHVTDLKKSTEFYQQVMQLPAIPEPFGVGNHSWFQIGACQLHLIGGAPKIPSLIIHTHLAFTTPSMSEFIERLKKFHVEYGDVKGQKNIIQVRPDGVEQVFFQDPDGYWIEVNNAVIE